MNRTLITLIYTIILGVGYTQSWNQISVPTSEHLNDIEFPEGTTGVGYIGGDNLVLLKTIDGGLSWFSVDYSGIDSSGFVTLKFFDLEFVSDEVGFATVGYDLGFYLYKTIDGGFNWTEINSDQNLGSFCYKNTLEVIDENHYFVGGRACFSGPEIAEFNNGEWSLKQVSSEFFNSGEYVRDIKLQGDFGIASTSTSELLRTIDGGQSWSSVASPIFSADDFLTDVLIINDSIMYAGMRNNGPVHYLFFESTDSGVTWAEFTPQAGDMIMYASWHTFTQNEVGMLFGSASSDVSQHFMHSAIGGTWSYEAVDQKINAIIAYGSTAIGVGENGYVILQQSNMGITDQSLGFKIYPSPAFEEIKLETNSHQKSYVTICDVSGAKVYQATIKANETINVSTWNTGTYIVKIVKNGNIFIDKFIKE
ncbi:T9SS type A sorting domain-containing protein [Crocinitomicaceae bacterium]|nr:T9SS type A sorting domain-containing protein [Crocinitomicaceae bacterium]